jgi:hypothetical protein
MNADNFIVCNHPRNVLKQFWPQPFLAIRYQLQQEVNRGVFEKSAGKHGHPPAGLAV